MSRVLDVYLYDRKAGTLSQGDDGALGFAYGLEFLSGSPPHPLSVSMPLGEAPYPDHIVRPYFSGLLPDERARRRLASALGVSDGNAFGLLEIIGGECAGALSLYHPGETPPPADDAGLEALSDAQLADILEKLRARPLLGGEEGVRLSLAGAQDKLAVCMDGEVIALAKGGRPTTHILKPFIENLEGSVENELFCMRLAARLRLQVPAVAMRQAGDIPFLLVERYDRRRLANGQIERIHQEDFCQALSVPPELKYEDEGGPGVERSLALIAEVTARPAAERLAFLEMLLFHYLVGNADAHAKNFALLYRDRVPDLAPLYDVVCTAAYPSVAKNFAMAIGGRAVTDTIQLKHWLTLVPDTRGAQRLLISTLRNMAAAITGEAEALVRELADERIEHPVLAAITAVIDKRAAHILRITDKAE
ncbi:MAG TPA: type II toxin-antitoxin system HipA family toxin [Devosiaceae bacterium]|jgi:serine/threonine-protein kinase HipA|nr:type II toxin-antitoxin system HipA family toxin [Devosiaceae bacterium]